MMVKIIKADKLTILQFIKQKRLIWVYDLVEKFKYTDKSARERLRRLKRQGLVINMTRGCYELTEEGYKKIKILAERQEACYDKE